MERVDGDVILTLCVWWDGERCSRRRRGRMRRWSAKVRAGFVGLMDKLLLGLDRVQVSV